ncbi:hypothetical protein LOK49_LG14G01442 [Camellia lanceoleosa]|uniref:Uncharacterized protein n=1 Tax=Camellia lanceoleosa TaxID=1840588 RepID=A0ACC0FBW8_9ERIC|nr:hypothetical protein LOK49_LG14G01442 [Camellia lanceoleosa]
MLPRRPVTRTWHYDGSHTEPFKTLDSALSAKRHLFLSLLSLSAFESSPIKSITELTKQNAAADCTGIFHNGSIARDDPMSFPYTQFPVAPFPWKHIHGTHQPYAHSIPETCGNLMVDLNQLHNLQNPLIDLNSMNVSSYRPSLYRQDLPFPEGHVKGVSNFHDKIGAADTMLNGSPYFNSLNNPEINFTLIGGNAGGGYEMTGHGREADGSHMHRPQMKNFVGLGGSKTTLSHPQNSGEMNIDHHDQVNAARFGCPKRIDGSFLSLGIGGKTDAKSKFDLNSREITGNLDGAFSPQLNTSHVRQATGISLNPGHNFVGGFSSFQNSIGGFPNLGYNVGGWTPSNNNVGVMCDTTTDLNSSPFHILQRPQADMQRGVPQLSNRNVDFVGNRDSRHANSDPYKGFIGELAASSGPFSSCSAGWLDSGQTGKSVLVSESEKFTWTTTQPASDQLHKRFMETAVPTESSMVSPSVGFKGSSIRKEHSALKDSAAQAVDESAQLLKRKRVQPTGQVISTAKGYGLSQASDVLRRPSLKRGGILPPPTAPRIQRRKISLQPPIHPSVPFPPQTAPAGAIPIPPPPAIPSPAAVPHIKWQDSEGLPQPTGQKCMLCKRDLSFTPEGPVYQPAVSPPVAVLPCGHTFHDRCLQLITPEDQSKNPPCIPCAIGET